MKLKDIEVGEQYQIKESYGSYGWFCSGLVVTVVGFSHDGDVFCKVYGYNWDHHKYISPKFLKKIK